MEKVFKRLSDSLFEKLNDSELLVVGFEGEKSQFIRFNNARVRQTGLVDDGEIDLRFISFPPRLITL